MQPSPLEILEQFRAVDDQQVRAWNATFGQFSAQQPNAQQLFGYILARLDNIATTIKVLSLILADQEPVNEKGN